MKLEEKLTIIKNNVHSGQDFETEIANLKLIVNTSDKKPELKQHLINVINATLDAYKLRGYDKDDFDSMFQIVSFTLYAIPDAGQ